MKEETTKSESLKQLQTLRNVGVATAERLYSIGIKTPEQLKKSDPKELYELFKDDGLVKSHKSDGTVKSSRCKARESLGMRRTYQYAAVTKDEAQRRRWTFYEAVKDEGRWEVTQMCSVPTPRSSFGYSLASV